MGKVCERPNLQAALKRVRKNKGSPGIDGMTVDELPDYLRVHWERLRGELLSGTYQPQSVKRQQIPKSGGGMRELGIPKELEKRGHAFVRYADDCNVYVRSRRVPISPRNGGSKQTRGIARQGSSRALRRVLSRRARGTTAQAQLSDPGNGGEGAWRVAFEEVVAVGWE